MANFEFLGPTEMSDDDEISDDLELVGGDNDKPHMESSTLNAKLLRSEGNIQI